MKHFKFCVKLTGVVGVGKGGFETGGQGFEMSLSRGLRWECDIPSLSLGVRVLLQQFQLRDPCPVQCQLLILSQILLSPSVTFMWKFWAKMARGCRTEGGRNHPSLTPAAHPQEELEVSLSIPSCQRSSLMPKSKNNKSWGEL